MLYKVLISLNDKGKWLIFLFCLNREGHNRSKSEDDKPIVPDHDLMYDRNGSLPLTSTRYAKFKMYRWLHKRKSKLFFHETGLDLIILLKFLFLWNIWPYYKITCYLNYDIDFWPLRQRWEWSQTQEPWSEVIGGNPAWWVLSSCFVKFLGYTWMSMWDICHLHQFCYRIKLYFRILGTIK